MIEGKDFLQEVASGGSPERNSTPFLGYEAQSYCTYGIRGCRLYYAFRW